MRRPILQAILAASFLTTSGVALADLSAFTQQSCTDNNGFYSELNLANDEVVAAGGSGPFGAICVTLSNTTSATVQAETFDSYVMGDGGTLGLVVNANIFTSSSIAEDGTWKSTTISPGGPDTGQNEDGFGLFNFVVDNKSFSPSDAATLMMFTLTNASGWSDVTQVLAFNSSNVDAEMHIRVPDATCKTQPNCTGFVAEGPQAQETPEPGSVALLGIGFLGVALTRRRPKGER